MHSKDRVVELIGDIERAALALSAECPCGSRGQVLGDLVMTVVIGAKLASHGEDGERRWHDLVGAIADWCAAQPSFAHPGLTIGEWVAARN